MPRSHGTQIQNNFVGGLNTEATALQYPPNCCTEVDNVVFQETGRVTRRGALDLEDGFVVSSDQTIYSTNEAFAEYLWTYVGSRGTTTFLVQQQGSQLHFYDVSSNTTPSANKQTYVVDLTSYKVSGTDLAPAENVCDFAQGNGLLIVVNAACKPFYVAFDNDTRTFSSTAITVQYRDFFGLDDGYELTARPAFVSVATMKASAAGAKHYYNLLNQGWWQGPVSAGVHDATQSAMGLWDAARADMPSNADSVGSFRSSPTVPLDTTRVNTYTQGNTPAPRGHFILELGVADRVTAAAADGFSVSSASTTNVLMDNSSGIFGNFTNNSAATNGLADTNYATATGSNSVVGIHRISTISGYTGIACGGSKAISYASLKAFFTKDTGTYLNVTNIPYTATIQYFATIYAKNGVPASATDGTAISAVTAIPENTLGGFSIATTDSVTAYTHVWVFISGFVQTEDGGGYPVVTEPSINLSVSEVSFYEAHTSTSFPADDVSYYRPSCTAFFASRAWYAGLNDANLGNNIYFSRIIENPSQVGECYQQNDPTSEVYFDLLPSDGGVIRIPEAGRIVKLFNYQTTLIVFATNGVWTIRGSSDRGGFTADAFSVRRISSIGTQSPKSFVDVKGFPIWWSEEGIQQIDYNPQFDSFQVTDISEKALKRQYLTIPAYNRRFVKGTYDSLLDTAYWIYSDSEDSGTVTQSTFNKVLTYHTRAKAFSLWTLHSTSSIQVRGLCFVQDSIGISSPKVKFTATYATGASTQKIVYGDEKAASWTDWKTYADTISLNSADKNSYESYFISGYRLDGETMRFFQSNYINVFLETVTNSGCYVQGVFNFATNGNSGGWGTRQNIYNASRPNDSVVTKRLKIRGKGRAIQLKFTSMPEKPFTIIGWSVFDTANADV